MYPSFKCIKEMIQKLASETDAVKRSDFFKDYLKVMSGFWNYSYYNQLLIYSAMPSATRLAGFRAWQKLGRAVVKGSKSIKILAPCKKKVEEEEVIVYFRPVSVFDISQTDGKALPEVDISLQGNSQTELLNKLMGCCQDKGISLKFKQLNKDHYGYNEGEEIVINSTHSVNTQINTLVHELAHEFLHKGKKLPRQEREIQAEGVAYVVCQHLGLEAKSFNYLALYDADAKKIMESLKVIAEASKEIIKSLTTGQRDKCP